MNATQDPTPGTEVDVAAIAAENQRLRQQLLEENEKLRAALAESRAAGVAAQGLTDEDVRRLEHPEEFVQAENDEFRQKLADLQAQLDAVTAANAGVPQVAHDAPPAPDVSQLTDDELQAELDRRKAAGQ